jgi:hypothetical protein
MIKNKSKTVYLITKIKQAKEMLANADVSASDIILVPFWVGVIGCVYYVSLVNQIKELRHQHRDEY